MAEQLANGEISVTVLRTVYHNEWSVGSIAKQKTCFGEKFLAYPALSGNQDRLIELGELLDLLQGVAELSAEAEQFHRHTRSPFFDRFRPNEPRDVGHRAIVATVRFFR
jgi:hypothetical protein